MTRTTSYEISKKLKEAGFEDSYIYAWYSDSEGSPWIQEIQHAKPTAVNKYGEEVKLTYIAPAYDLETILDALPKQFQVAWDGERGKSQATLRLTLEKDKIFYKHDSDELRNAMYWREKEVQKAENESLADTAGRLWLMLKGLV